MKQYNRHPENTLKLALELKQLIDDYWSKEITEEKLREYIEHYSNDYPERVFSKKHTETEGFTPTLWQRLGRKRIILIKKCLKDFKLNYKGGIKNEENSVI